MKENWQCEEVFLYSGIENGDTATAEEFEKITKEHSCVVRAKTVFAYKNPDKNLQTKCRECQAENVVVVDMGYRKKSNCDVELSVDAVERAGPGSEFLILTGDGDFSYLIQNAIDKGTKVYLVSNAGRYQKSGITKSRFSTKFRQLIAQNTGKLTMIDIKSWKEKIKK